MAVRIDIDITENQLAAFAEIPDTSWFTQYVFRNAVTPIHPNPSLAQDDEMKQLMINDWIDRHVKGKRVLDLFSANGGFSIIAAIAGAKEVVGVEFSHERIQCAELVYRTIQSQLDCHIEFKKGDVYDIGSFFDEPFDVVLCLGGLYHIADPPYVLRQIASLAKERLILQTSHVLPIPGDWARFTVR